LIHAYLFSSAVEYLILTSFVHVLLSSMTKFKVVLVSVHVYHICITNIFHENVYLFQREKWKLFPKNIPNSS
jgi:hypothetical protein